MSEDNTDQQKTLDIGTITVSTDISVYSAMPYVMMRDKPSSKFDSGWYLFSGEEPEAQVLYTENKEIFDVLSYKQVLEIDDSIADILVNGAIGSLWERFEGEPYAEWTENDSYIPKNDFRIADQVTPDWVLQISQLFIKSIQGNDLFYTTYDKSVKISHWQYDDVAELKEGFIKEYEAAKAKLQSEGKQIIHEYDWDGKGMHKIGHTVLQYSEERGKNQYVLHAYSIVESEIMYAQISYEKESQEFWASETWELLEYRSGEVANDD